jgi:parallel beta-helix repeat protein
MFLLMTVSSANETYMEKQTIKPSSELIIDGPTLVKVGVQYNYYIYLNEPEDDFLFIRLHHGDGEWTEWLGPYESYEKFVWRILWPASGFYTIQAEARCNDSTYYASLIVQVVDGNILYVGGSGPGNYTNIQDAIDNASDGDTIFVYNGTYGLPFTFIDVYKSINLIGENKVTTIINASKIRVNVSEVLISSFTLQNNSGIQVLSSNHITITDNIINNSYYGIMTFTFSNDIMITNNTFFNCGLIFWGYNNLSNNNTIINNTFFNCGLMVWGYNNVVSNNTVNGKPLIYLESTSDKVIDDAGQVILIDCTTVSITNLELTKGDNAIQLYACTNCYVKNNVLSSNAIYGVSLVNSTNNTISGNIFKDNYLGLLLTYGEVNNISGNHFENDILNVGLQNSDDNLFFRNNFLFNISFMPRLKGTFSINSDNTWDGNYWNRARLLPVFIWGTKLIKLFRIFNRPCLDFDWHPAQEPYDI